MPQYFGFEIITNLTKYSTTQVYLPGGAHFRLNNNVFNSASNVYCTITTSGLGGLDIGALNFGLYYAYLVYNGSSYGIVISLSSSAPTGFTSYRQIGAVLINSGLQVDTVYPYAQLTGETLLNTRGMLSNNSLLKSTDFPDTTGLYVWPINGPASFSGSPSFGADSLTQVGAVATANNHLSNTVYGRLGGSAAAYADTANFDDTGSFTAGGWFQIDNPAGVTTQYMMSKLDVSNTAWNSWYLNVGSNVLSFVVNYNNSGGIVTVSCPYNDAGFHHIVCVYDQASTSMMIVIDGKVTGYTVNSSLSARNNNSNVKMAVGCRFNAASPITFMTGKVADIFYKKSAMTFAQIRQIYVAGTKLQATLDLQNKVKIAGENLGDYWIQYDVASLLSASPSISSVPRAVATPYKTPSGEPRFSFNWKVILSTTSAAPVITISGVAFKSGISQAVSMMHDDGAVVAMGGYTNGGTGQVAATLGGARSSLEFFSDLETNSLPSWALDLSQLY